MAAQDLFVQADARVSVHEGGYVNHPKDPGGATNSGITQRVYDDFRRRNDLAPRDVRKLTEMERIAIYRQSYWNQIKGDQMPPGVGYVVYDGAVNSGVSQSVKWLQRALGNVKVDGVLGPTTLAAVRQHSDPAALIEGICERRMAFLKALKTWKTFGKGWTRRVNEVRAGGLAMVRGNTAAVPSETVGEAKGRIEDAKPAPGKGAADAATGGGTISVIIAQAQEQLTPYVNIGFVAKAMAILTIGGTVLAICGIAWRFYAAHKQRQRADALDLPVPA